MIWYSFLVRARRSVLASGLVSEDDALVIEEYHASEASSPDAKMLLYVPTAAVVCLVALALAYPYASTMHTAALFVLASIIVVLWSSVADYLLLRLQLYLWSRTDRSFHNFYGAIRRREAFLFGLLHADSSDSTVPCAENARRHCLRKLLRNIALFQRISRAIVPTSEEKESLMQNFENELLHDLVNTGADGTESDLELGSLKSLWQYMYLTRSEMIRIIVTSYATNAHRPYLYFPLLQTLLSSGLAQFRVDYLDVKTDLATHSSSNINCTKKERDFEKCVTHICWVLERLQKHQSIPSNSGQLAEALRTAASIMEAKASMETNSSDTMENMGDRGTASESVQVSSELQACLDASQSRVQEPREYKVYEGTPMAIDDNADVTDASTGVQESFISSPPSRSLVGELKIALKSRKEECLAKEREALARLRNVPVEDIDCRELDPDDNLSRATQEKSDFTPEKKVVRPLGGMPTASDIAAVLLMRRNQVLAADERVIEDDDIEYCSSGED